MWFDSWSDIGRIVAVGASAYLVLLAVVRLAGKRTLSQFNAYDYVITVAFGSVTATILLDATVSLADGAAALALLAALQFVVAVLTRRWHRLRRLVTARPAVLVRDSEFDAVALRRHRMTPDDVRQAVRGSGLGSMADVAVAVLEADGSVSVIPVAGRGDGSALPG